MRVFSPIPLFSPSLPDNETGRRDRADLKAKIEADKLDVRRAELAEAQAKREAQAEAARLRREALSRIETEGMPTREACLMRLAVEMDQADFAGDRIKAALGILAAEGWAKKPAQGSKAREIAEALDALADSP